MMANTNSNFKKCAKYLDRYRIKNGNLYKTDDNDLLNEAITKLRLLDAIINQLKKDEAKERRNIQNNFKTLLTSAVLPNKLFVNMYCQRIEIYTYSFYYFAFRVYDILKNVTKLGIKAQGVVIVRNHLMEHPEGRSSRILSNSFGHIGPNGPVIKPGRNQNEKQIHMDKGLYLNSKEFEMDLLRKLNIAI